ncbi:D-TA family PLP-dependent enzyme [Pedobacter rhizosphaerae]|uniref:D-serine deaminase, pyridoxal phosphate-dependent n=1 Tax=Pedobacter rhizosphaerae TaxID=390241 RepID=A0A1H9KSB0_9SPHI|nr:D-TA family PLP-dependent enzyme [Pedobacter rhizosphaerae]SER02056.1 D-serine deaminase, pyridoxal phosphate-dependent [Pedobacter rhizosphaerae]
MIRDEWYLINNPHVVESPGLVFYVDRIEDNIKRVISMINDLERLRPHVKTHKSIDLSRLMIAAGISKFKCATIAEAEMLAQAGAKDVLLAYQPVGPNIDRFMALQLKYPNSKFSCLVDDKNIAATLNTLSIANGLKSSVWIDVNVGMDRTGILPAQVVKLFSDLQQLDHLIFKGLHAYDGHVQETAFDIRREQALEIISLLRNLQAEITARSGHQVSVVAGGSPTYTVYNVESDFECSPGTFALWDKGYQEAYEEQHFACAALVISRIVSLPEPNLICCDLGHKAVAAEKSLDRRVVFLNAPALKVVSQSEEHLVLDAGNEHAFRVGDLLYGLPYHICPTVALYESATCINTGLAGKSWPISSRKRKITI